MNNRIISTNLKLLIPAALIALGYPDIEPSAPKRKTVEDLLQYR